MKLQSVTTILSVLFLLLGGAMVVLGSMWVASSTRYPEGAFITVPAGLGLVGLGVLLLLAAFLGLRRLTL